MQKQLIIIWSEHKRYFVIFNYCSSFLLKRNQTDYRLKSVHPMVYYFEIKLCHVCAILIHDYAFTVQYLSEKIHEIKALSRAPWLLFIMLVCRRVLHRSEAGGIAMTDHQWS